MGGGSKLIGQHSRENREMESMTKGWWVGRIKGRSRAGHC